MKTTRATNYQKKIIGRIFWNDDMNPKETENGFIIEVGSKRVLIIIEEIEKE